MKCPRCSAEIAEESSCRKCGFKISDRQSNIEVEYKDFKTSELLEIRTKSPASRPAVDRLGTNLNEQAGPSAVNTFSTKTVRIGVIALLVICILIVLFRLFFR